MVSIWTCTVRNWQTIDRVHSLVWSSIKAQVTAVSQQAGSATASPLWNYWESASATMMGKVNFILTTIKSMKCNWHEFNFIDIKIKQWKNNSDFFRSSSTRTGTSRVALTSAWVTVLIFPPIWTGVTLAEWRVDAGWCTIVPATWEISIFLKGETMLTTCLCLEWVNPSGPAVWSPWWVP